MKRHKLITIGPQRFRVGPWHADESIAYVGIDAHSGEITQEGVSKCLERIDALGFRSAISPALREHETETFISSGFEPTEILVVLQRTLGKIPPHSGSSIRRTRRWERRRVLPLDKLAFDDYWQMDTFGLSEALAATPSVRFTVHADPQINGYTICGLNGSVGYLQRLAVHPNRRLGGIGSALVCDAMEWLASRSATRVLVNTQEGNTAAIALYERLGFSRRAEHLTVLCSDW